MTLFPSTRTDYLDHERAVRAARRRARPARDLATRSTAQAIVKSVLFGYGTPANSFLPPQVPFYDPNSPGLQYNMAQAKAEMAKSKFPKGFKVTLLVGAGAQVENAIGQILQEPLKQLGIDVTFKQEDTSDRVQRRSSSRSTSSAFSYWTMDIADPDELVDVRGRPGGRRTARSTPTTTTRRWSSCRMRRSARRTPAKRARALHAAPEARRARRVPGLPVLLAVPLCVLEQGPRVLRVPARQLPPGGRLARVAEVRHAELGRGTRGRTADARRIRRAPPPADDPGRRSASPSSSSS